MSEPAEADPGVSRASAFVDDTSEMDPVPVPACGVWLFPEGDARTLVDHAVHAEEIGLDAWWLGDEGPGRDPFSVLAGAAVRTSRIRLAVGIANPYSRHPGLTASTAQTVHELSDGRFVLGIGAGGDIGLGPFELRANAPLRSVERAIRIARAVGAREPTEGYQPQEMSVADAPGRPPMPVFVGARGEQLNRLASRVADGAFVAGIPPVLYDDVIAWVRSVRPIEVSLYPTVAFTEEEADTLRPHMVWALMNAPANTQLALGLDPERLALAAGALRAGDESPARSLITDDVMRVVMLWGSPREVGERLADLVRRYRPDGIGLALGHVGVRTSQERAAEAFSVMGGLLSGAGDSDGEGGTR